MVIEKILNSLPLEVARPINSLSNGLKSKITEIRLRVNKPISFRADNKLYYLEEKGYCIIPTCRCPIVTAALMEDCFFHLCNKSVYSHENELSNGYISTQYGCRVGVCGTIVSNRQGATVCRDVSSLNIRIAHQILGVATPLINLKGGILICGAPHSGKTTVLRDYVRQRSNGGITVGLVDCRGEISGSNLGTPMLDVGINTDIVIGGSKEQGIEQIIRTMSPDMVAFDEIGSVAELNAVKACLNAGVTVITTLHVGSKEELLQRNCVLPVLNTMAFNNIVLLDKSFKLSIYKREDIFDKAYRFNIGGNTVYSGGNIQITNAEYKNAAATASL